jgi:hypothetical protein
MNEFSEFADLRFPYTMFILKTNFNPLLLKGRGGGENPLVEVTVSGKEEHSKDFFPITSKNSVFRILPYP